MSETANKLFLPRKSRNQKKIERQETVLGYKPVSYTHLSSITAIQMIRFYAMIGNGGYLVTPRVGRASTPDGLDVMQPFAVSEGKKLLSERTCERVRSMMVDVVSGGTARGTFGAIGLNVGGKTGTSRDSQDGDRRTFSFIGMNPIDDPDYVVLVTIRKPETPISVDVYKRQLGHCRRVHCLERRKTDRDEFLQCRSQTPN